MFTVSGSNLDAIQRNAAASATLVRGCGDSSLTDVCAASNRVKGSLRYRLGIGAIHAQELAAVLEAVASDRALAERLARRPDRVPRIAFAFTGQGSQHPGMTRALIESSDLYRRRLDKADRAVAEHLGGSIVEAMMAGGTGIGRTRLAQPAIFAVGYALARTLVDLGIEPDVVVGHSVGELAAAVIAGVLPLAQAAALVTTRGALMDRLPEGGGCSACAAAHRELEALVTARRSLAVAAHNGPRSAVISGGLAALAEVEAELARRGIPALALDVSHAFHSPLMEPMLAEFRERTRELSCSPATTQVVSTVTGEPIAGETMDGDYWARHIQLPVRFVEAIGSVAQLGVTHVVEVGARPVLTRLMADIRAADGLSCLSATSPAASARDLVDVVAALYRDGASPRWELLYEEDAGRPTARLWPYEFSRANRFWSDPVPSDPRAPDPTPSLDLDTPASHGDMPVTLDDAEQGTAAGSAESTTYQLVVDALCKVSGNEASRVGHASRLSEDLGLDSMMLMTLKRELETSLSAVAELDVRRLLPHLETVGTLVAHLDDVLQLPATNH